jgi:hypothetical protein
LETVKFKTDFDCKSNLSESENHKHQRHHDRNTLHGDTVGLYLASRLDGQNNKKTENYTTNMNQLITSILNFLGIGNPVTRAANAAKKQVGTAAKRAHAAELALSRAQQKVDETISNGEASILEALNAAEKRQELREAHIEKSKHSADEHYNRTVAALTAALDRAAKEHARTNAALEQQKEAGRSQLNTEKVQAAESIEQLETCRN